MAGTNGMGSMGSVTPTLVVPQMSASCPANVKNEMGIMSPGGEAPPGYHGNYPWGEGLPWQLSCGDVAMAPGEKIQGYHSIIFMLHAIIIMIPNSTKS